MANMTIDEATEDDVIGGSEYMPASDGGAPKKIKTSQIAAYVLKCLRESGEQDFATTGTVSWKTSGGALKFSSGAKFAQAIIAYAFASAGMEDEDIAELESDETVFVVKVGDEEHIMTLAQLATYLQNQIIATIELNGLTSADTLSGADLMLVAQTSNNATTNKKVSLSTVRTFILAGLGAYLNSAATTAETPTTTEYVFSYNGTTLRKWTLGSMLALAGDVHGPSTTTANKVPQWDSVSKTLKDGLTVSTALDSNSTDAQLPTAKAAKNYADAKVASMVPNATVAGNIPVYSNTAGALGGGKSVVTSVTGIANASAASDDKIPTEKAIRAGLDAEKDYVDNDVKFTVGTHSEDNIAVFGSSGRNLKAGPSVTDEVRATGADDTRVPTEKAVKDAIDDSLAEGVAAKSAATTVRSSTYADNDHVPTEKAVADALDTVVKTGLHADGEIPLYDGTGALLKGGTSLVTEVRNVSNASNSAVATEKAVRTAVDTVQTALDNKKLDELATPSDGTALDATSSRHGLMSAADKDKLDNLENTENADDLSGDIADGDLIVLRDVSLQVARKTRKTTFEKVWDFIKAHILSAIHIDDLLAGQENSTNGNATTSAHGFLPKLLETHAGKFLRADGQWEQPPGSVDFRGATAEAAGVAGIVPAPALGVTNKFLQSNGQWGDPPIPVGASNIVFANISDAPILNDDAKVLTFDGSNYYLLKIGDFAHRWDTIWIPAGAMAPDSAAAAYADSVVCAGNSTVRDCIRFGTTRDSFCDFNLVLPDDFDPDSGIKFKLHWSSTGSAVQNHYVRFSLASLFSRPGDEMSASLGAEAIVDDQILSGNANMLHVTDAAAIVPAGTYAKGANLHFRLGRLYTTFTPSSGTKCSEQVYLLGMQVRICRRADGIASPSQQEAW